MPSLLHHRSASGFFIFVTILLDALGLGLLIPVMPSIMSRFLTNPAEIERTFGYFISIYAAMQFFASPVLGGLSDRFGRRPVLLCSLLGASLDYVLMAKAPTLFWLFFGRIIAGLTGASITVASSYMADVSTDETRAQNFGLIGAGFGLGFILGPALGGLLGHQGPEAPFFAAAALTLLNFLFGLFVLPESLSPDKRRRVRFRELNPIYSLSKLASRRSIFFLAVIYFLIYLGGQVHPSNWTLYTQHKFHWTTFEVGMSLSCVGLAISVVQGGLTRIITPRLGESKTLLLGLSVYVLGFFSFAVATRGWMMYPLLVVFAFSGLASPALQALMTQQVSADEQGELQGSLMSMTSLTSIVGPLCYTYLFSVFARPESSWYFPGVAYLLASCFSLIALILYLTKTKFLSLPIPGKQKTLS